jgi:diguanylate cyclase (GGDEF)-like protein
VTAQLAATRALLRAVDADEVVQVVATLVRDLGGAVVPARIADADRVMQMDVSFGRSEPMLPWTEPVSLAAMRLAAVLPDVMEDAHLALSRLQAEVQRDDEATRDVVTGLLTRRAWMRRLSSAGVGDSVALLDLDHFKSVNDTHGHEVGDATLREVGSLLNHSFREGDLCGRYGGDELVCLTRGLSAPALVERCASAARRWTQVRPAAAAAVTLSVGVAPVDERGGRVALQLADRAMYRAKAGGRDRVVLAMPEDDDERDAR